MTSATDLKILDRPPLLFVIAKTLVRHKIRGGWRLFDLLDNVGYLKNKVVRYKLKKNYSVLVPTYGEEKWDHADLHNFEHDMVATLRAATSHCEGPLTIVDCGADIGLVSVTFAAELGNVTRIFAFEPNSEAFTVLQHTLAALPIEARAVPMAVSNFTGRGELRSPAYDPSSHARYLEQVPDGSIAVTTIDSMEINAENLLLKIDVEGAEINVIRGASHSLAAAKNAFIALEAHPKVFNRTGIDPVTVLREIAAIRPFKFTIAETGESNLDLSRPFFEQQNNDTTVYNIICSSL